jgi:hypothetical protein
MTAEAWSFWVMFIAPIVLHNCFTKPQYYTHFIKLVHLIHLCLAYKMKPDDINLIRLVSRSGLWNTKGEYGQLSLDRFNLTNIYHRIFYQCDPERISTCPVIVHSLLHIADGIEAAGLVWTYWSFVMERYCGFLKRDGVQNRGKPYASLDNHVQHVAQLNTVRIRYNLIDYLSLKGPKKELGEVFLERA